MNVSPATAARQIKVARAARAHLGGNRLAYSTHTGERPLVPAREIAHEHVMTEVYADLPGDRTVGSCFCGEPMDTGTWDERNA